MSYMFELFDIVQGARGRRDSNALNQSQNQQQQQQHHTDSDGESQHGHHLTDDSETQVGNDDHHPPTTKKMPSLNLSSVGRTKSLSSSQQLSPRSLHNSNNNNNNNKNSPRSLNNSNQPPPQNTSNSSINHASINISTASIPNFQDSSNTQHLIDSMQSGNADIESGINESMGEGKTNTGGQDQNGHSHSDDDPEDKDGAGDGDDPKKPDELDFEKTGFDEHKIFVKPKGVFKWVFLQQALKYHWDLFIIAVLVTLISCAYITFYITFGSRYVFVEDKDQWPKWGKIASIISGVVNEQFLVMIGYCILRSQFGHKQTKVAIPLALCFSLASILLTTFGRIYEFDGAVNYIPKYMLSLGNIIFVSLLIGYKSFKRPMFAFWFTLPFVVMVLVLVIYDFFLLKWYIRSTSEISKSIIRIIVHPVITAVCLLISRVSASQMIPHKPRSTIAFILLPLCFNTFYGRFFGTTMNSLAGVAVSGLLISLVDMIWKCSLRLRDSFIVRYLCRCSKDASFYMQHNLPLYAEYQSHELIYEISANFVATFLVVTYFYVYSSVSYIPFQFKIMAMQLSFTFVTEFVVAYVSLSYLKLPIIIPFSKRPSGFLFVTIFCWLVGIAYSSIRIINILNGNWIL
ncbi:hypothetical protein DLAC_03903 [Tieghemostelium lacteum]|uniref:Transmembrane protein n=1 Tax=Tieghemostelium lacteum TaxID=361077 RepID=A0A152A115_TIELA|nr:hypothetical protein DLAC_03903 [Tieghemostelium lacteum]|eukprot:KYQ99937.1 hypothetical protein DLAC_03903 [Tieghemostelium lacteum]